MPTPETKLLQGTLDMLILKALSLGPLHGYGVGQRIMQMSQNDLHRNCAAADPRGVVGLLDSGAAGDEGRPNARVTSRLIMIVTASRQVLAWNQSNSTILPHGASALPSGTTHKTGNAGSSPASPSKSVR